MSIGMMASDVLGGDALRPAPLLMTVANAERMLCVGHTKIYELIRSRELEAVKQGKKTCIVVASAVAYVERLRAAAGNRERARD